MDDRGQTGGIPLMGHIGWVDFTGELFFDFQSRSKSLGNLRHDNRF